TLTQVHHGRASRTTAQIDVSAMADGEHAGLGMLQIQPSWIGVVQAGGVRRLVHSAAGQQTPGPRVGAGAVQLRQHVAADQTVRYEYSVDGGRSFHALGGAEPMRFSWWKGARPALFNWSSVESTTQRGHVDVDGVQVEILDPPRP